MHGDHTGESQGYISTREVARPYSHEGRLRIVDHSIGTHHFTEASVLAMVRAKAARLLPGTLGLDAKALLNQRRLEEKL